MFRCTDEDHDITVVCGYWCKRSNHVFIGSYQPFWLIHQMISPGSSSNCSCLKFKNFSFTTFTFKKHVIIFIRSLTWGSPGCNVSDMRSSLFILLVRWIQSVLQTLNPAFVLMSCSNTFVGVGAPHQLYKKRTGSRFDLMNDVISPRSRWRIRCCTVKGVSGVSVGWAIWLLCI